MYYFTGQSDIADDVHKNQNCFCTNAQHYCEAVNLKTTEDTVFHSSVCLTGPLCLFMWSDCLFVRLSLCVCYRNISMNKD